MQKKMRFLLILLALCLGCFMIPINVRGAEAGRQCGDQVYWNLSADGTLLVSGSGSMWDYPVEYPDFYGVRGQVRSLIIADGVTSVGNSAFYHFDSLETVSLPEGLERIQDFAFHSCTQLKEISIPATVQYVGSFAFAKCSDLQQVLFFGAAPEFGISLFSDANPECLYPATTAR